MTLSQLERSVAPSWGSYFAALAVRAILIAGLLLLTNLGAHEHALLLYETGRWGTLVGFLGVWVVAAGAVLVAALQPDASLRVFWAAILALGGAFGFAFHAASGTQFSLFDAVSLWSARHEAGRALDFYGSHLIGFALVLTAGFLVLVTPLTTTPPLARRMLRFGAWVPMVPVILFAGIIYEKQGGGTRGLPAQFAPYSIAALSAFKIATDTLPARRQVVWTPHAPGANGSRVRKIVLLVDESVRSDYIDFRPGNPFTPELARFRDRIVDFGPAVSGGNCSHYSNAILRFMGAPDRLGRNLLTNPTIWQYAEKAGYRTVFIDAQAAFIRRMAGYPGKLQNFMTPEEAAEIDSFHTMQEGMLAHALDDALLDIMKKELASDEPVLIYATKNGAHFPYDAGYPPSAAQFHPTMTEDPGDLARSRVNSYRNVVRWSVDRIFGRLFKEANLDDTVVIYTSDHGQIFADAQFTQCTVEDPDPRQGLVPLFLVADNPVLRGRFAEAASASRGHGSHFAISPTLLHLMGYAPADIATEYGPSLLEKNDGPTVFTSGDVFGLFSENIRWNPIELTRSYLEPEAKSQINSEPLFPGDASAALRR